MMTKKQALLGGIAACAVALAAPAHSADLLTKAPAPAPVFSWTGCYAGAHVGWGWSHNKFQDAVGGPSSSNIDVGHLFRTASASGNGGIFGGQLGCDYQWQGPWVVGIQGSVAGANIRGATPDPYASGSPLEPKTDFLADVTGRVGYTWSGVLLYAKGGGAWAHESFGVLFTPFGGFLGTGRVDLSGGVAGAGIEWAFAPNWSAVVEYDHYFFGSRTSPLAFTIITPPFPLVKASETIDAVKVGLNFRFNSWPPPAHR